MTLVNINAWTFSTTFGDDETPTGFSPVDLTLEFEGENTSMTYTVVEANENDLEIDVLAPGLQSISIDGVQIEAPIDSLYAFLSQVSWSGGNEATVFYTDDIDRTNDTLDALIFQLSGDALPELPTLDAFIEFTSNASSTSNMPAGFQAGDEIDLASVPNAEVVPGDGEGEGEGDNTPTEGDDVIVGTAGDDFVLGNGGNDEIRGGAGNDDLRGNAGRDVLYGDEGNDSLKGGKGADMLFGGADDDILKGNKQNDELYGGTGDDTLKGGLGDDLLEGGEGNDELSGGKKNDTLDGGAGDDILKGGFGADVFIFNGGADVITDFGKGADQIDIDIELGAEGGTTLAEFIAAYGSQVGADTVFDFGSGNSLTLEDVTLTSLVESDFLA